MNDGNELVTKKVILLYIADRLAGLTEDEFMDVAIDTIYMDYFEFSHIFKELLSDGFLRQEARLGESELDADGQATRRVDITEAGQQILESLYKTVPLPVRKHLEQQTEISLQAKADLSDISVHIYPEVDGGYLVRLSLLGENQAAVLDLAVNVPTREMAQVLTQNWTKHHGDLYPKLLTLLLKEPKPEDE